MLELSANQNLAYSQISLGVFAVLGPLAMTVSRPPCSRSLHRAYSPLSLPVLELQDDPRVGLLAHHDPRRVSDVAHLRSRRSDH